MDLLVAATLVYRSHCEPLLVILKLSGGLLEREICRYGSAALSPIGILLGRTVYQLRSSLILNLWEGAGALEYVFVDFSEC